jgi:t-SNARE complex subunit (syntaxin)
LLKELEDNLGQLKKAEKRMLEVSSLLSVFSAKVLEQEEQIDAIYDSSVKSVTYLKGSHHELRQALRHGQASRFGVFFFLVSASLSLLFFDWYSQ